MAKVTVEVTEELAEAVRTVVKEMEAGLAHIRSGKPVDFAELERRAASGGRQVERELVRRFLQGLDVDAPFVTIDGTLHARVGRYAGTYRTQAGEVEVERSRYRAVGERNALTVDPPVTLRAGCVGEGWLPETAKAMAWLVGSTTPREAKGRATALHRLPYSRTSFQDVAGRGAHLYEEGRVHVEVGLIEALVVPEGAACVSLLLDRIALPMEEPKPRPVGRPREGAAKRPIDVVYRMAYAGCFCFHNEKGEALRTVRLGRMPEEDVESMCARLALHVEASLRADPALHGVVLTDGAPERHGWLDAALAKYAPSAQRPWRLVDFWHLLEKLAAAVALLAPGQQQAHALRERGKLALLNKPGAVWGVLEELHASGKREVRVGDGQPVRTRGAHLPGEPR